MAWLLLCFFFFFLGSVILSLSLLVSNPFPFLNNIDIDCFANGTVGLCVRCGASCLFSFTLE